MTAFLQDLLQKDPVLVLAIIIIIVLMVYIEMMRLKIMFITRTLDTAFNSIRNESQDEGSGCLGTFVMLIVVFLLMITFLFLISKAG
jgi:hypothetical protein